MPRLTAASACLLAALCCTGCTSLLTARAIDKFADSLAQADVEQLKAHASKRFEQQALRRPEALEDIKVLNVPTGKTTVLMIEDVSDDEKQVTVKVGEKEQEVQYRLTRAPEGRQWLVDDVLVTQTAPGETDSVTRSVADQMDLLLTVREFLEDWRAGSRDEVLELTTPEFRALLGDLPPAWLQQFTAQMVADNGTRSFRPEARLERDQAVVLVPRSTGKLIVDLKLIDGRWRVGDVAHESRGKEQLASARQTGAALRAAAKFLEAYSTSNRDALAGWSAPLLYDNSLVAADLATVPLPVVGMLAAKYELHRNGERMDLLVPHGKLSYMVSLVRPAGKAEDSPGETVRTAAEFVVDEVTIYDDGGRQSRRMSAVLTSQAVVELFASALSARDLPRLQLLSTAEFCERAWNRLDAAVFRAIPLWEIEPGEPHVVATVFQGPAAEITVTQGTRALTYVLRSHRGRMLVDDVLMPVLDRPNSLRANLELLAPVYHFALAVQAHDMQRLRSNSADGLNRIGWGQLQSVPDVGASLEQHLALPLRSLKLQGTQPVALLDDGRRQTRVRLVAEGGRYVVQDVELATGPRAGDQITLLSALRQVIAARNTVIGGGPAANWRAQPAQAPSRQTGGVVPAAAEIPAGARQPIEPL